MKENMSVNFFYPDSMMLFLIIKILEKPRFILPISISNYNFSLITYKIKFKEQKCYEF